MSTLESTARQKQKEFLPKRGLLGTASHFGAYCLPLTFELLIYVILGFSTSFFQKWLESEGDCSGYM